MEFMGLFGRGETGTLLAGVDYGGGASLASLAYDVQERVVRPIASPHGTKFSDPVSLAVGEALYVMDREAERRAPCRPPAPKLDAWTPHQPRPAPVAPLLRVEQLDSRRAPARPAPTLSMDPRTLDAINPRRSPHGRRRPEGCQHPQATTPWNWG
jgi:hypothetical protein